jgi:hypothetical protein
MSSALSGYRLRESLRARRVLLRVTLEHGLEVVIPAGFDAARIPALLEQRREWIRAALGRIAAQRRQFGYDAAWSLPGEISLPALGRVWRVTAQASVARSVRVHAVGEDELLIVGCIDDERACRAALGRWLLRQAQDRLLPRLRALSIATDLSYRHAAIRRQRTRWGSCSRQRKISLNARLLFLDPALVDYVLLHELCHLKELNHSRRFWSLVATHAPDFRAHDRALRDGWKVVPRWAS